MSITFPTTDLKVPSGITALPSEMKRPGFGTLYGFDAQQGGGGVAFSNAYSLALDGTDDYVSTSSFDLTTNKTVSFWIKLDSISSAGVYLFGKGASYYSYITSDGQTMYKYNGSSAQSISISAPNAISTGAWQHIVITGDGSTSVLYKNGTSIGTGTDLTPTGLDRFGGDSVGGSRFIDGLMDEVAVWNATLTADDVTAIYNSGVPNDLSDSSSYDTDRTSNLVHWWRMGDNDGASGTTITDQGSGSNDATLTNGPTFSTEVPYVLPSITNAYSLSFDGTDDYLLMGSSAINLDTNFTMSAWFKPDTAALSGYDFMAGWGNSSSGQSRVMQILNSKLSFEIYLSRVSGSTTLVAGTWYHGVVTFSGNNVEIFLNGSSDGTGTLSRVSMSSSATFVGGTAAMTAVGFVPFAGLVDEFAVFNSVLSSSDVTAIYNSGTPADLTSLSPVGWWRMGDNDGGAGTTITDQGSGSNDATLTNGPTYSPAVPPGYSRKSVDFDGTNDYCLIDTGLESELNGNPITASAWFKADSYASGCALFSCGTSATDNFYILPSQWGGLTYCGGSNGVNAYLTLPNPSTGAWHHIVFVMNGASSIVYLDGVLAASGSGNGLASALSSTGGNNPTVGKFHWGDPYYMDGNIDEVAVWNTALTGAQCVAIYNSGVPADLTSLSPTGWWRMGDGTEAGSGTTVYDMSSNSNNGTLTNGPTYSSTTP